MAQDQETFHHQLEDCQETVRHLEEENHELREAAGTFGQLAERLNSALREERRQSAADRRSVRRNYGDRRRQPAALDTR